MLAVIERVVATAAPYCGLGILWGWVATFWTCLEAVFGASGISDAPNWLWGTLNATLAAIYLGAAFFARWLDRHPSSRWGSHVLAAAGRPWLAVVVGVLGSLSCVALSMGAPWTTGLCGVGFAAGASVCMGLLMMGWVRSFDLVDADRLDAVVLLNILVSSVPVLVGAALPAVGLWLSCALPVAGALLLAVIMPSFGSTAPVADGVGDIAFPGGTGRSGLYWAAATTALVYLTIDFVNVSSVHAEGAFGVVAATVSTALSVVLAFVFLRYSPRVDPVGLSIVMLVLLLIAVVLWRTGDTPLLAQAASVLITVDDGISVLLLDYFVLRYRGGRLGAVAPMGFILGCTQVGSLVGWLLGFLVEGNPAVEARVMALLAVGAGCLLVPLALLPRRVPAAERPCLPEEPAMGAGESAAEGRLDATCRRLARDGGLSAREAEVLQMLARGRSRPYIREQLCISTSTVASHAAHIYAKLGVHSKQELIDLVERAGA